MAGSIFGNIFRISTWGESHGKGIGVVIDGCPAGIRLCEEDIQKYLDKRKPGQNKYTTARRESDTVEILSGIFEGKTTGTPISLIVFNQDQRSKDYGKIAELYRPGHADYTFDQKYGFRDYRGGGRSSGRETIGRVAAGAVAMQLLKELGIDVTAYVSSIGPITIDRSHLNLAYAEESPVRMPDADATAKAQDFLNDCIKNQDSCGGSIECIVSGMPAGVGEPVFDKLDASLARAIMSIGAVKAVEIGDGVQVSQHKGSENNDTYVYDAESRPQKNSNHAGGIYGGISDGSEIFLRASFKATPSIARPQQMLGQDGQIHEESIHGRHDPIIVSRAAVVVETMTALVIADQLLANMASRIEHVKKVYEK